MSTNDIITAAYETSFYSRVNFIALKTAQNVATEDVATPNHDARLAYAGRIMIGQDSAQQISLHIAAVNPTIAETLETQGGDAVPDGDIEYAMGQIWDARANAWAAAAIEEPL